MCYPFLFLWFSFFKAKLFKNSLQLKHNASHRSFFMVFFFQSKAFQKFIATEAQCFAS